MGKFKPRWSKTVYFDSEKELLAVEKHVKNLNLSSSNWILGLILKEIKFKKIESKEYK